LGRFSSFAFSPISFHFLLFASSFLLLAFSL